MRNARTVVVLMATVAVTRAEASAQARPTATVHDSQTVVFVCEHGTVKSVVAMALFTQMARDRHLPIRAISRGTAPEAAVPTGVQAGLRADRLTLRHFTPTKFSEADLANALTVISFDQPQVAVLVAGRVPTRGWDSLPAVSENYGIARDSIRRRVISLVDSLDRARSRRPAPR